jgi:KaiC
MNRADTQPIGIGLLPATRGPELRKAATGIRGLDEITLGGLPKGRPTLVCGGPGSGKTLLALTCLVNGALQFDEPGVLMTFEENGEEVAGDVTSLGFDLPSLIAARKLAADCIRNVSSSTRSNRLFGPEERRRSPIGVAATVPVAEGSGRHRRDHGRAGRGPADHAGTRGVRVRRGDSARPSRPRTGFDAPPARGHASSGARPPDRRPPSPGVSRFDSAGELEPRTTVRGFRSGGLA